MKRFAAISLLVVITMSSLAQLNESDTMRFQFRGSITGSYQQGNVNLLVVRSKVDFSWLLTKKLVFKTQNSGLYQAFTNRKADNDLFSRNYIYFQPRHKIYPFGMAYVAANFRRKIKSRVFGGAGITAQLVNTSKHVFKLSASIVYETSQFNGVNYNLSKYNGRPTIAVWRPTFYMAGWHYLADAKLRFYYDAYWQPAFNQPGNYRTQVDAGMDLPIWKGLLFTALFGFTHENVVISGIKQEDKLLTFGISYQLKKKYDRKNALQ